MSSSSGRFTLTFNGEIYNFEDLRRELRAAGHSFRGSSDTEVMLASFEEWGVESSLRRFNGMFAFAVWDENRRSLTMARDRLGQKPLFVRVLPNLVEFGSELRALGSLDGADGSASVNRTAVVEFLRHSYVPSPRTVWQDTWKLPPGTLLEISAETSTRPEFRPRPYWSLYDVASAGANAKVDLNLDAAADALDALLRRAVARQLVSDVPIGAFLSGGIDSSLIVALMRQVHAGSTRTFTIGFEEEAYDEAPYAKRVAEHLGTEHTEHYVTSDEALSVVEQLPAIYDEPFADSSQIPTYLLCKLARKYVTVALSGDGGDELFGGYRRYSDASSQWDSLSSQPAKRLLYRLALRVPRSVWRSSLRALSPLLAPKFRVDDPGYHVHRAARRAAAANPHALYAGFLSHASGAEDLVIGAPRHVPHVTERAAPPGLSFAEWMMYTDGTNYLPDDIHTKVDRASMAVSLEARAPFMDHDVVELAWQMPQALRMGFGEGKIVLRRLLGRYVPRELFERPKRGFGVPISDWLRGPLRDWADELLSESRLRRDGIFKPEPIVRRWQAHRVGKADWGYHLWDILMFEAWYARYADSGLDTPTTPVSKERPRIAPFGVMGNTVSNR